MAINHSLSHGAVSLATLVGTQTLTDKIDSYFPSIHSWIAELSAWCVSRFDLPVRHNLMEHLLVALVMGMIWGIGFWSLAGRKAS